jgi:hypothetical protein
MADHNGSTVNGWSGTVDVLEIGQSPRRWMRPSRAIQRKQQRTLPWNLSDEVAFQPRPVLSSLFDGSVDAWPLTAEDGQETQFGKRADRLAKKKRVQQLELSILGPSESLIVDGLTKLD